MAQQCLNCNSFAMAATEKQAIYLSKSTANIAARFSQLGARLRLHSTPGQGTEFGIVLA